MSNQKRARDVDRDLAIDFVEAAWADGQLTRDEYDVRVDRLLRSSTLADLERDVSDLQGPGGAPWSPGGEAVPVSHLARDRAFARPSVPAASARTPSGEGGRWGIAVAIVVLSAVTLFGVVTTLQGGSVSEMTAVSVNPASPQSADGYRALVDALDDASGDTVAFEVVLKADRASGLFPTGPTGAAGENRMWDERGWSEPTPVDSEPVKRERLNLEMITPEMVEDAYVQASLALTPDPSVVLHLRVERINGVRACLRATSSTADGERLSEYYDCQGQLIEDATALPPDRNGS